MSLHGSSLAMPAAQFRPGIFGHAWLRALGILLMLSAMSGCSMLRTLPPQEPSHAVAPDQQSRLGVMVESLPAPAQGESMFRLLESGRAALVARLALVERADKSLDLQYYLMHGIELYELKPTQEQHRFFRRLAGSSSRTSLHSKVMVFDREVVYIGSMNLDPRSLLLNTESGLLIRGPALAEQAARFIERELQPQASYRVRVIDSPEDGKPMLAWLDGDRLLMEEPNLGFWARLLMELLSASQWEELL